LDNIIIKLKAIVVFSFLYSSNLIAKENQIYQTDSVGIFNIKILLTSYKKMAVIQTDPIGNKQYNKQQYQIKGDKTYRTDSVGNIQYHQKNK